MSDGDKKNVFFSLHIDNQYLHNVLDQLTNELIDR